MAIDARGYRALVPMPERGYKELNQTVVSSAGGGGSGSVSGFIYRSFPTSAFRSYPARPYRSYPIG